MFIYNVTHIDLNALMPHLDIGGTHNNITTDNYGIALMITSAFT